MSKENRDNYQIYNTALVEYNNTKDNEINKLIRKYTVKNIWIVIFYSLITALCVCFGVTKSENEWKFLVPIGSVILLAIPFIRPLINHGFIRDALFIYLNTKSVERSYILFLKKNMINLTIHLC